MLSEELRKCIVRVATALFKTPIRSFVPEINYEQFIENEESIPLGARAWLSSTKGSPSNAMVQLILLSLDPKAHERGEEPYPFIVSKEMRTDGWQTASAIALEAGIAKQWPKSDQGITDISKRPRLQTTLSKIREQAIDGTRLSILITAIQMCIKSLSMTETTEAAVEMLKEVCAHAIHLNLSPVTDLAMEGVCIGLADVYASKIELGEARFEIANDLDKSGRYTQKAIQAPIFQAANTMTKASVEHAKALVHEKMHADIERYRIKTQSAKPSTDEGDYIKAMMAALRHFEVPISLIKTLQTGL